MICLSLSINEFFQSITPKYSHGFMKYWMIDVTF